MRKQFIVLCILAQIAVPSYMAGHRELILHNGESWYLRTAPIDPRDIFRGDFVILHYTFNSLPLSHYTNNQSPDLLAVPENLKKGQQVFASLEPDSGGIYGFRNWSDHRPKSGHYLSGRISHHYRGAGNAYRAKFGIEQYFVEQGKGLDIEARRGRRNELQIPMEVKLAVSKHGEAVLQGYRWSKLGIKLEMIQRPTDRVENPPSPDAPPRRSPIVKLTLENTSDGALRLFQPDGQCAFSISSAFNTAAQFKPLVQGCAQTEFTDSDFMLLQAGEQYSVELDLAQPRWAVETTDQAGTIQTGEIGQFNPREQFRIVYNAPAIDGLNNAISNSTDHPASSVPQWQGRLSSQAFTARGRID